MQYKEGISFEEEQLLLVLVTVLSIITANEWSSIVNSFINKYFKNKLRWRLIYTVILTIVAVYFILWLVNFFKKYDTEEERKRKSL
jgi:predicted membrane protein